MGVAAISPEAEVWLDDMDRGRAQWRDVGDLPVPVAAVVVRLSGSPDMMSDEAMQPRARVCTAAGTDEH